MKQKSVFITAIFMILLFSKISAQDIGINIIMQPAIIPSGGTGKIEVRISNNDPGTTNLPAYKIRPLISVPSNQITITGASDLPAGWWICSNNGADIRVSNGTDAALAPGEERLFHIDVTGTSLTNTSPATITGTVAFAGGTAPTACDDGPPTTGNQTANDNSTTSVALPVTFEKVEAKISNNELLVNWTTSSETNNDHFEIQAMDADSTFKTIGEVESQAKETEGNSELPLEYSFSRALTTKGSLMGIAVFAIGFIALLFNRRNKIFYVLAIVAGMGITTISCKKYESETLDGDKAKFLIRVVQVDIDGKKGYSKVVQAVKE